MPSFSKARAHAQRLLERVALVGVGPDVARPRAASTTARRDVGVDAPCAADLDLEAAVALGERLPRDLRAASSGVGAETSRASGPVGALGAEPALQRDAEAPADRSCTARSIAHLAIGWPGSRPAASSLFIFACRPAMSNRSWPMSAGARYSRIELTHDSSVSADQRRRRPGLAPADVAVVVGHLHQRDALAFVERARRSARQRQHRLHRQADGETSIFAMLMHG